MWQIGPGPLQIATKRGHKEVIERLYEAGAVDDGSVVPTAAEGNKMRTAEAKAALEESA